MLKQNPETATVCLTYNLLSVHLHKLESDPKMRISEAV